MKEDDIQTIVAEGSKSRTSVIAQFLVVLGGLMLIPMFSNQFVSGPLVNALLFIVTIMLGLRYGMLLSVVPSSMALVYGLLPAFMAPFIPFIIISNILMVFLFKRLSEKNFFMSVGVSAVAKFIFLFIAHQVFLGVFLQKSITQTVSLMMSWNQLYTALLGGLIAFGFLKFIKRI